MTALDHVEPGAGNSGREGEPLERAMDDRALGDQELPGAERGEDDAWPVPVERCHHEERGDEEERAEPDSSEPPAERGEKCGEPTQEKRGLGDVPGYEEARGHLEARAVIRRRP